MNEVRTTVDERYKYLRMAHIRCAVAECSGEIQLLNEAQTAAQCNYKPLTALCWLSCGAPGGSQDQPQPLFAEER